LPEKEHYDAFKIAKLVQNNQLIMEYFKILMFPDNIGEILDLSSQLKN
jgi:hypothetical protein